MFFELLKKEFKQVFRCTTYYLIVICMVLFYVTQMGKLEMIQKPEPNQEDYGFTVTKDERVIMNETIQGLFSEYSNNLYVTYPIGFYKEVTLSDAKQAKILQIMSVLTGKTKEEIEDYYDNRFGDYSTSATPSEITVSEDINFDYFIKLMEEVDKLLGGGSSYSEAHIMNSVFAPRTYEQALQEYNNVIIEDHLSNAYARLFSDYFGIILCILPVFLAVTRALRDKRAKANQVIYVRKASSLQIILSRYLAMVLVLLIPVAVIATILTVQCVYNGTGAGIRVDYLAFGKYILGWLLPNILITLSVGLFFTELTQTAIGILIQGIWWFVSVFMGTSNLRGGYGWNLVPRHNMLGGYEVYRDNFGQLVKNRLLYTVIAIVILLATVYIYDKKRKGMLRSYGKINSNRKSESED